MTGGATTSPIGRCVGCGAECVGERISGSIYSYVCEACTDEVNADLDGFLSVVRDGGWDA